MRRPAHGEAEGRALRRLTQLELVCEKISDFLLSFEFRRFTGFDFKDRFLLKLVFEVIFVVTLDFGFGYSTTPRDGWV